MNPGDCFRQRNLVLRFCRKLSDGLLMFVAVNPTNGDIFSRPMKESSLKYLRPLKTEIYKRIVKKL